MGARGVYRERGVGESTRGAGQRLGVEEGGGQDGHDVFISRRCVCVVCALGVRSWTGTRRGRIPLLVRKQQ